MCPPHPTQQWTRDPKTPGHLLGVLALCHTGDPQGLAGRDGHPPVHIMGGFLEEQAQVGGSVTLGWQEKEAELLMEFYAITSLPGCVCGGEGTQQRAEASRDRWPGDWEHRSQTGRERQGRPHPTCLPARPLRGPDLVGAQGRWPMGARPPAHSRALPPAPGAGLHTSGSTETGAAPHQERWGLLRSSCPVQGQGLRGCPPPSRLSQEQQERDQVLARLHPPPAAAALGTLGALSLWPCHCGL